MRSKHNRVTEQIEMVETHNLAICLRRLRDGEYSDRWRRALYHALTMTGTSRGVVEKIRIALELP